MLGRVAGRVQDIHHDIPERETVAVLHPARAIAHTGGVVQDVFGTRLPVQPRRIGGRRGYGVSITKRIRIPVSSATRRYVRMSPNGSTTAQAACPPQPNR